MYLKYLAWKGFTLSILGNTIQLLFVHVSPHWTTSKCPGSSGHIHTNTHRKTHKVYKSYSHARFPQDARGDSEQTPCFTGPTIQKHSDNEDGNPNWQDGIAGCLPLWLIAYKEKWRDFEMIAHFLSSSVIHFLFKGSSFAPLSPSACL